MSKSAKKAADQAEREKVHKRYSNRREPDVIYPAKKQVDFYDADIHQRVAVYVRVSTDNLGQETSYELQKNYYEEFVLKHPNWELVKIYADKGISGTSTKHRVELKWNRFRIHKSTLNKMGNPQYVQFLVNPEEMFIAVLGSDRPLAGGTSNRVKLVQTSRHYSIEFYSNTLLCALVNMIGTLDFQYSYRMSGEVDVANRVAYFSMKTLKKNERRPPSDG